MKKVFLVQGRRTPFGRFGGKLMKKSPVELAFMASKDLLDSERINAEHIDQVYFGNVVPATSDTLYAGRHLALKLGAKESTPGLTLNRLCGSGLEVAALARDQILLNRGESYLSVGSEAMSLIPHVIYSRWGTKYGDLKTRDYLQDALTDKYINTPMGMTGETLGKKYDLTRQECDQYALDSHLNLASAYQSGKIQGEIADIEELKVDEHLRTGLKIEDLQKLRPSFDPKGLLTAGNSSGIVDGACALFIASEDYCSKQGMTPLAEIVETSVIGVDPHVMGLGPVAAIDSLLKKTKMDKNVIERWEINEAFSSQVLSCVKELQIPKEKVNVWGGAIALGHPLAASGARILLTLARQLKDDSLTYGVASACIGGGMGMAALLKRVI